MKTQKTVTTVIDEVITITEGMAFVTMTDKFLSGWGCAEGKIAKRVIVCNNFQEDYTLASRIYPRHGMTYVNVKRELPYYSPSRYVVSYDKYSDSLFNF